MTRRLTIAAVVLLAGLAAGPAMAADLISYPLGSTSSLSVDNDGYDWNGFYAGVFGVAQRGGSGGDGVGLGIDFGVNTTFNFALVGGEVAVSGLVGDDSTTAYVQGLARAGVLVANNTVIYGATGYGFDASAPGKGDLLAGAGVEHSFTDNVSLRAQYLHGFPVAGGSSTDQITLGAQYHF